MDSTNKGITVELSILNWVYNTLFNQDTTIEGSNFLKL